MSTKSLDIIKGLLDEIDRCGVRVSPELEQLERGHLASPPGSAMPAAPYQFDAESLATILAALRYWQENGQCDASNRSNDIHDIATDNDDLTSLTEESVDELCDALNCDEVLDRLNAVPTRVIVECSGGLVRSIHSNDPTLSVDILDHDELNERELDEEDRASLEALKREITTLGDLLS